MTPRTPHQFNAGKVGKQTEALGKVLAVSGFGVRPIKSIACDLSGKVGKLGKVFPRLYTCARKGVWGTPFIPFLMRRLKTPSLPSLRSLSGVQPSENQQSFKAGFEVPTFPKTAVTFPTFPDVFGLFQQIGAYGPETTRYRARAVK